MVKILMRALALAYLFACLISPADAHHRHHRHHHVEAPPPHKVHKPQHRQQFHRQQQFHEGEPVGALESIRKTAEAAAPPPPPDSVVAFAQDVINVFTQTTVGVFTFVHNPVDEARDYVQATSIPGFTMFLQGRPVALSCLNPEFVVRLADAIKEARSAGIMAGVYSACRPPVLRIGGMADKSQSMHAVGLAVDIAGIGSPGSTTAASWGRIAAAHGLVRPYATSWEFNHFQPTNIKVASQVPPMKKLLSPFGPTDLTKLWQSQEAIILAPDKALAPPATSVARAHPHHHNGVQHVARA